MSLTKEQIQDCRWILKALTEDQTKRPNKSPTEPTLKQPEWQNRVDALCDLALERLAMEPLNHLAKECHVANQTWWHDPKTGERLNRNKGELLMLIVSEISEAMEGERKNLMDDKLPHRKMAEVELADALIRIFDYAGAYGYDLDGACAEKRAFNATRADHKPEARLAPGGKAW